MVEAFPRGPMAPGYRYAVAGRTGSGKSYWMKWAILSSPNMRWIVLDTKHDPIFNNWKPVEGLMSMDRLHRLWKDRKQVVIRPRPEENNNSRLDDYVGELHDAFDNFGIAIDEIYQLTLSSHPKPGLTGLLTRGRVRGQTVICGMQRPSSIPMFIFSEAYGYVVMSLNLEKDRIRFYEMTGDKRFLEKVKSRHWLYYDVPEDTLTAYSPVSIR